MPRALTAKIVGNVPVETGDFSGSSCTGAQFRLLTLQPLTVITAPEPGQFYMVQAGSGHDPLLKRPFSIYSIGQNRLGFLYRVRGKGTLSLSRLGYGDTLQVIGPLGNSYPEPSGDFIVVAGGIGIASLIPLMRKYEKRAYLFYGAMKSGELVMLEDAAELSRELFITTDDGSRGQKGLITDAVKSFLGSREGGMQVYACGPAPMLKALSEFTLAAGIVCHASLEEHMACGIGACLGCMVKVRRQRIEAGGRSGGWEYRRVCKEGPVFDVADVIW